MSNDLNYCSFIGRVGKDIELKYLTNGDPTANFSIACGWKAKEKEGTEWVSVSTYGKLAELVHEYTGKGSLVYVSGRMRTDKYQKDGVEKYSTKIIADKVQFLSRSEKSAKPEKSANTPAEIRNTISEMNDDIPF